MSRTQLRRRRAAFTLVELLVSLALVGVALAAASFMLLQAFANERAYSEQNAAQQNARTALDTIGDDMRGAWRVTTLVTSGTVQATLPTNTVMGTTAGNVTPTNISNHATPLYFNIVDDNDTQKRIRYWLNGTNLRREIVVFDASTTPISATSATAGTVVARNIIGFTAQKPLVNTTTNPTTHNHTIVRVTITSRTGIAPAQSTTTLQSDITLRNNLL